MAGNALARLPLESVAEVRRQPEAALGHPLPAALLKHADEQTVAGLAAVFRAARAPGLGGACFHDWGVLAAPYYLGQACMAVALQRFEAEGAWGVSPHVIPHRSLHSVSGTVSQALKIHGPNFGVGGGRGGTAEALLAAAALLGGRRVPGVWVVLTAVEPELPLAEDGDYAAGSCCVGLALALLPARAGGVGLRLRVVARPEAGRGAGPSFGGSGARLDLFRLHAALEGAAGSRRSAGALSDAGVRVEVGWSAPRVGRPLTTPAERWLAVGAVAGGAETER